MTNVSENKIKEAINLAVNYGGIGGEHHKDWVIDQMVQILAGGQYDRIVKKARQSEDGHHTYEWNKGIAP